MFVYNLFKGCEIALRQRHNFSSYVSGNHKIKANLCITIDYKPELFKDFRENCTLRDIIIYENYVYYYYSKCTLISMIVNTKEEKITLGINGDWHKFLRELPEWIFSDIRIAKIEDILKDD